MKVLVTGGAGYIGTELIYKLDANSDITEVIVYDNLSRPNYNLFIGVSKLSSKIKFVERDILDTRNLKQSLKGVQVVYHLAAKVSTPFADQNAHYFEQINNWGTSELIQAIEESDVKKFIYLSSVSVYGATSGQVDVDNGVNPRTFYGISKMRGEEHASRLLGKIPTYIFRCGNVYGYSKSMRFDAVINKFMIEANFKGRININGDGTQVRSFVHINEVSSILNNIINSDLNSGIYDLVSKNLKINDIVGVLHEVFNDLEMIYVNQHLKLREINVKPNKVILSHGSVKQQSFTDELKTFKDNFSF